MSSKRASSSSPAPKRIKLESPEIEHSDPQPEVLEDNCSICLQPIADRTVIPRCSHEFCFECLMIWSDQSRRCPLCSQQIGEYLIHHIRSKYDYQKHYLPPLRSSPAPLQHTLHNGAASASNRRRRPRSERVWGRQERQQLEEADRLERAIARRKWIYEYDLYAKHVASNSHTRYRPYPSPAQFAASPNFISRATAFLRRELRVWPNLDVEFLTTFVISLMKAIDIRSESAVKLMSEFLDMDSPYIEGGRYRNAEHFAHEIYSFIRSPYKDLFIYDSVVQYDTPSSVPPPPEQSTSRRWYASRSRSNSRHRRSRSPARSPARSRSVSWSPSGRTYPSTRNRQVDELAACGLLGEPGPSRQPQARISPRSSSRRKHSPILDKTNFTDSRNVKDYDTCDIKSDGGARRHTSTHGSGKGKRKASPHNAPTSSCEEHPKDREARPPVFLTDASDAKSNEPSIILVPLEAAREVMSSNVKNGDSTGSPASNDFIELRADLPSEVGASAGGPPHTPVHLATDSPTSMPQLRTTNGHDHPRRLPRNRTLLESVQAHLSSNAGPMSRLDKPATLDSLQPTTRHDRLSHLPNAQSGDTTRPLPPTLSNESVQVDDQPPLRAADNLMDPVTIPSQSLRAKGRTSPPRGGMPSVEIMARTRAKLAKLNDKPFHAPAPSHLPHHETGNAFPSSKAKTPSPSRSPANLPLPEDHPDHSDDPAPCEFSAQSGKSNDSLDSLGSFLPNLDSVSSCSGACSPTLNNVAVVANSGHASTRAQLLRKLMEEKKRVSLVGKALPNAASSPPDRSSPIMGQTTTQGTIEQPHDDSQAIEAHLRSRAKLKLRLAAAKKTIERVA